MARHRPLRPLCDAKFGRSARSRLYDDLYIVAQRDQETHEALDRISPEPASQHSWDGEGEKDGPNRRGWVCNNGVQDVEILLDILNRQA